MTVSREIIDDFLAQKRIAIVGVSRNSKDFSTQLFRDLRACGYDAVPVTPAASEIEGLPCFRRVQDVTPPPDAALLMTRPEVSEKVVRDCAEAGIRRVWLYRGTGVGAVSAAALSFCREHGIDVVPGYCPYMFLPGTGFVHRVHGFFLKLTGGYPKSAGGR